MDGHQSESEARVAIDLPTARIDAHTHFIPLKFLDFVEKIGGCPFHDVSFHFKKISVHNGLQAFSQQ